MAEIYNMGIGLTAVDNASPDIRKVDAALGTLWEGLSSVVRGTHQLEDGFIRVRDAGGRYLTGKYSDRAEAMAGITGRLVETLQQSATETMRAGSGFSKLGQVLSGVGKSIKEMTGGLEDMMLRGPGFGDNSLLDFEHETHQMATALGGAGERAENLRYEILALTGSTQFSVGQITALAQELSRAGVGIDEMSVRSQQAAINLQNTFGVAGDEIAKSTRTVEAFGGDFVDTLDETTATVKSFGVDARGAFQALPGVIGFAQESMVQFGATVTGDGRDVVKSVMGMGATFSKTFGKTMAEAINDAQQNFQRFANATKTSRRVFLGLTDEFDPLTMALMEAGVGFGSTGKILRDAQGDALGFAGQMRSLIDSLGGRGSFRGSRLLEQLRDELPEATMRLIENDKEYQRAFEQNALARQRAAELEGAGFADLSDEMLNTTKALSEMWDNTKQLIKVTLGQIYTTLELKDVFRDVKDTFSSFAGDIQRFVMSGSFKEYLEAVKPVVQTVGKGLLYFGTVAGGVVTAMGSLATAIGTVRGSMRLAGKVLGPITEKLPGLGRIGALLTGAFKTVGRFAARAIPGLGQIIAIVSGVSTAFSDMSEVMGDPLATGGEKFMALIRGLLKGVGSAVNSLLLGIPGMILDHFFPDMERNFDAGFASIGDKFAGFFGDFDFGAMFEKAGNKIGEWVTGLGAWIGNKLPEWSVIAKDWGKTIGSVVGGLGKMILDGLVAWNKWLWPALGGLVVDAFNWVFSDGADEAASSLEAGGPGILSTMGDILWGLGEVVVSAMQGIGEGILNAFGTSTKEVQLGFQLLWNYVESGAAAAAGAIMKYLGPALNGMYTTAFDVVQSVGKVFISLMETGQFVFDVLGGSWDQVFGGMKIAGLEMLDTIVTAFYGEGGFIPTAVSAVQNLLVAMSYLPGMDWAQDAATNLEDLKNTMVTGSTAISTALSEAQANIADQTDLAAKWEETQGRINENQQKFIDLTNEAKGAVNSLTAPEFWSEREDQLKAERKGIELQLSAAAAEREAAEQRRRDARLWREETNQGLDAVFSQMRDVADDTLNARQLEVFDDKLRDALEGSLRTIANQAAQGEITMDEARTAWEEAKRAGLESAMQAAKDAVRGGADAAETATTPAAAAAAAGGPGGQQATDPAMWQALIRAMENQGGRVERVDVRLGGASAIEREMARQSDITQFNNGN